MKVRVLDQLHVSSVSADTMPKGTVFAVSAPLGKELVAKGLVEVVEAEAEPAPAPAEDQASRKAEPAPANKAEQPPPNKAAGSKKRG